MLLILVPHPQSHFGKLLSADSNSSQTISIHDFVSFLQLDAVLPDGEIHPQFFENWGNLNVCKGKIIEDFPNKNW